MIVCNPQLNRAVVFIIRYRNRRNVMSNPYRVQKRIMAAKGMRTACDPWPRKRDDVSRG